MRRFGLAVGMLLSLLSAGSVAPRPAYAVSWTLVAKWEMNEPAAGAGCTNPPTMIDESGFGSPANGTVRPDVALDGGGGSCTARVADSGKYVFPGWRRVSPDPYIDIDIEPFATIAPEQSRVEIPSQSKLIPGMNTFKYVIRFKPANVWRRPAGAGTEVPKRWLLPVVHADATYNMLQTGWSNALNGGQVKIELIGNEEVKPINVNGRIESRQLLGLVRCTFRTDDAAQTAMVYSLVPTNDGPSASKIECGINRATNKAFITVIDDASGPLPVPLINEVPLPANFGPVSPTDHTSIGKKPGSTDPNDAYAGDLRYVRYFIGAA